MHVGVLGQEGIDPRGLVRRQVIGDHVDLLGCRLVDDDFGQEGDELGIGVLEGGIRIARDGDIGMLGPLTFFLRQLHEWRATPARG